MSEEIKAQGFLDLLKFSDKDLVDKIVKILKTIEVEESEEGVTRISIYLKNK